MKRNESQFVKAYTTYHSAILYFIRAKGFSEEEAQDLTHETFGRLWQIWENCVFDQDTAIKYWLYRTAIHVMRERRRKEIPTSPILCENDVNVSVDPIRDSIEQTQYTQYIEKIEQTLPEPQKTVFRMIMLEGKSYQETSKKLTIKETTLRSIVCRLRKSLEPYTEVLFGKGEFK